MKSDLRVPQKLPTHIAFIMDGNGRWAKKRLLPRKAGHSAGVKTMHEIVNACFDLSIPYVTVYAFSTENKDRPQDEVQALFRLMEENFGEFLGEAVEKGNRITIMGDVSYFPDTLRSIMEDAVQKSKNGTHGTLNIALNYGSRAELVRAVNAAVQAGKAVDESSFAQLLYTADLPSPDLVVRTGGESRLSNFMLWQCAYSELVFSPILWPDFDKKALYGVLNEYAVRDRRFGKVKE